MKLFLASILSIVFLLVLACFPNLINVGELVTEDNSGGVVSIIPTNQPPKNEDTNAVDLPTNSDYGFSAQGNFEDPSSIEILNLNIDATETEAYFYLGYSTDDAGDYLNNGLKISGRLTNASNLTLNLTNPLPCLSYIYLAVIDEGDPPTIIISYEYPNTNTCGDAEDLPVNSEYDFSAEVFFESPTRIEILDFSLQNAANAYFYLGYVTTNASDYIDDGIKISERIEDANDTNFPLTLTTPLSNLPYTHLAVINEVSPPVIISAHRYTNTDYNFSGEAFFDVANDTQIIVSNFGIMAANAFFYLGYGSGADDYLNNGLRISERLPSTTNTNFTLTLSNALASLPYSHLAVIDDIDPPVVVNAWKYSFSGEAFFAKLPDIVFSNFSLLTSNAFFYLGYGGSEAGDYLNNGLRISDKLQNTGLTTFTFTITNALSFEPYSHLAIINDLEPPRIVSDWEYDFSVQAIFDYETNTIVFSNFSLLATNAFFYLGYGSNAADYLSNGLKVSDKLEKTGLTNFTFTVTNTNALSSLPYTHLAVVNDIDPPTVLIDWRYFTPTPTSPYIGVTSTMPNAGYGTSGTKVTFVSERQIDVDLNFSGAPGAYFYLGFGGSASDYINNGLQLAPRLTGSANLTFTLEEDLADLPYTHIAIICVPFSIIINPGVQYK